MRFQLGDFTLFGKWSGFLSTPRVEFGLRTEEAGDGNFFWLQLANEVFDPKTLPAVLAKVTGKIERDGAMWMKDPAGFNKRR